MTNRINPYQSNALNAYRPSAQRNRNAQAQQAGAAQEAQKSSEVRSQKAVAAKGALESSKVNGLTAGETQMINRYFPASETMSLRLYGANRSTQTLNPGAVGTRLDISG